MSKLPKDSPTFRQGSTSLALPSHLNMVSTNSPIAHMLQAEFRIMSSIAHVSNCGGHFLYSCQLNVNHTYVNEKERNVEGEPFPHEVQKLSKHPHTWSGKIVSGNILSFRNLTFATRAVIMVSVNTF